MKKNLQIILVVFCIFMLNTSFLTSKVTVWLNKDYQTLNKIFDELGDKNWPQGGTRKFPLSHILATNTTGNGKFILQYDNFFSIYLERKNSLERNDTLYEDYFVKEITFRYS